MLFDERDRPGMLRFVTLAWPSEEPLARERVRVRHSAREAGCTGLALSADGTRAVTAHAHGAVRSWRTASPESAVQLCAGGEGAMGDLDLSPDGRRVGVQSSIHGELHGTPGASLRGFTEVAFVVGIDGGLLAFAGDPWTRFLPGHGDTTVVWVPTSVAWCAPASWAPPLPGHLAPYARVRFQAWRVAHAGREGRLLAWRDVLTGEGAVALVDRDAGRAIAEWRFPSDPKCVAVSPDGSLAALGFEDGTVETVELPE